MVAWCGGTILKAKGNSRESASSREQITDEERKESDERRQRRRQKKILEGKNSYQPRGGGFGFNW